MIVSMRDICKDYATGKNVTHVLKHVNLEVAAGDYLAIMGPSGSGKSTLMNLLGFLDVPTSGEYLFDGKDMSRFTDNQLADVRNHDIGFVFQSFHLLPKLTALDNAALPLLYGGVPKAKRREMAAEALRTVGLEDRMEHLPTELSGGQCQRVAIARAIVGRPKLLLADEPTGALDSESGRMILDIFRELHDAGSTIIMITHDRNVASHADRINFIYDGVLSATPPEDAALPGIVTAPAVLPAATEVAAAEDAIEPVEVAAKEVAEAEIAVEPEADAVEAEPEPELDVQAAEPEAEPQTAPEPEEPVTAGDAR